MAAQGLHDREDSFSSNSPFHDDHGSTPLYPPQQTRLLLPTASSSSDATVTLTERRVHMAESSPSQSFRQYDAQSGRPYQLGHAGDRTQSMPTPGDSQDFGHPRNHRNTSWDLLAGVRKGYEQFDSANASESHLAFADGDVPKNKVCCLYFLPNIARRPWLHQNARMARLKWDRRRY